jgi:two-component system, NarL family, nitrate/nitrite response regulator NarL
MQYAEGSGEETIRVLVADDTRIHTQLLADALRRDRYLEVISSPSHSRDLIEAASLHHFDVLVISSNLDEEPVRGFEVLRELRATRADLRAIMLLDSSKRESILQAFRSGARGIFSRHDSVETLGKCVRTVHQGQVWANTQQVSFAVEALASSPTVRAVDANGLNLLSKRELEVVRCLAEGLTNREIADRLGLSQHTIKNYLFRVFDKLGVSSRLELLFMTLAQPIVPQLAGPVFENTANGNHRSPDAQRSRNNRTRLAGSVPETSAKSLARTQRLEDPGARIGTAAANQPQSVRREQQSEKPHLGIAAATGGDPLS